MTERDIDAELKEFADAVKSCRFVSYQEISNYFGKKSRKWAGGQIEKCISLKLLKRQDWTNCKRKAKEHRAAHEMSATELEEYLDNFERSAD